MKALARRSLYVRDFPASRVVRMILASAGLVDVDVDGSLLSLDYDDEFDNDFPSDGKDADADAWKEIDANGNVKSEEAAKDGEDAEENGDDDDAKEQDEEEEEGDGEEEEKQDPSQESSATASSSKASDPTWRERYISRMRVHRDTISEAPAGESDRELTAKAEALSLEARSLLERFKEDLEVDSLKGAATLIIRRIGTSRCSIS
jgi:hypothetical protein